LLDFVGGTLAVRAGVRKVQSCEKILSSQDRWDDGRRKSEAETRAETPASYSQLPIMSRGAMLADPTATRAEPVRRV
jgi:hypothetical protein